MDFSPIPWSYTNTENEEEGLPKIYDADGWSIAETHGENNTQREVNARLMAASPELLKSLQDILPYVKQLHLDFVAECGQDSDSVFYERILTRIERAELAIVKAAGFEE